MGLEGLLNRGDPGPGRALRPSDQLGHLLGTVPCRLTWDAAPGIEVTSTAQSEGARPLRSLTSATRSGTPARSPGGFAPGSAAPGSRGPDWPAAPSCPRSLDGARSAVLLPSRRAASRSSSSYSDSEYGSPLRSILALPRSHVGAASSQLPRRSTGMNFFSCFAREGVGRHDVAFVTDPAATPVRPLLESGCADGDHEVVLADGALHERRDLVAGCGVPAVERHVDAVRPQPGGQLLDPLLVRIVVPGVGDEGFGDRGLGFRRGHGLSPWLLQPHHSSITPRRGNNKASPRRRGCPIAYHVGRSSGIWPR